MESNLPPDTQLDLQTYLIRWLAGISSVLIAIFGISGAVLYSALQTTAEGRVNALVENEKSSLEELRKKIDELISKYQTYQIDSVKEIQDSLTKVRINADNVSRILNEVETLRAKYRTADAMALRPSEEVVNKIVQILEDRDEIGKRVTKDLGSRIENIENSLMEMLPIGTILAWHKTLTGTPLPEGWLECNGQRVDVRNSPLFGKNFAEFKRGQWHGTLSSRNVRGYWSQSKGDSSFIQPFVCRQQSNLLFSQP